MILATVITIELVFKLLGLLGVGTILGIFIKHWLSGSTRLGNARQKMMLELNQNITTMTKFSAEVTKSLENIHKLEKEISELNKQITEHQEKYDILQDKYNKLIASLKAWRELKNVSSDAIITLEVTLNKIGVNLNNLNDV